MIRTILVAAVMLGIALYEGPPLIRHGHKREATIFFIVWTVALVYACLVAAGLALPNPKDAIDWLFRFATPVR